MIATKPNVRQGATAGLVVSAVLAAAAAGASNAPAETFIETLGVAVAATVGAVALVVAATSRAASTTSGTELAGFWIRAAAFVIDWVPFVLIGLVLAPVGSVKLVDTVVQIPFPPSTMPLPALPVASPSQ